MTNFNQIFKNFCDGQNLTNCFQDFSECLQTSQAEETVDDITSALFLLQDDQQLQRFISLYSLSLNNNPNNFVYVDLLLQLIGARSFDVQYELTKFVWQFVGFRNMIQYAPDLENGSEYTTKSLFRSIMNHRAPVNLDYIYSAYDNLINDQAAIVYLARYIDRIFVLNKAYSFDSLSIDMQNTSYALCLFCLGLMGKIVDVCQDTQLINIMLTGIQYIFLPLNKIIHVISTIDLNDTMTEIARTIRITARSDSIQSIYTIISANFDVILHHHDNNNFLSSLCDHLSYLTGAKLRSLVNIENNIVKIFSENISAHTKHSFVKLLISHNLDKRLFDNSIKMYVMNDLYKLNIEQNIKTIHLADIICTFEEVFSNDRDLIAYVASETYTISDYLKYVREILRHPQNHPYILHHIYDMSHLINAIVLIINNFDKLERFKMSFLNDVMELTASTIATLSDDAFNGTPFVEVFVGKSIASVRSLSEYINGMIVDDAMLATINKMIIHIDVLATLYNDEEYTEVFYNDMKSAFVKSRDSTKFLKDQETFTDKITCCLVNNPMFLNSREDILIDYRTAFNIAKTKINPYNRETISLQDILEYNKRSEIKHKIETLKAEMMASCK